MFNNFRKFTKQSKTNSENSITELLSTESDKVNKIPEKYLNINVLSMISGGTQKPEKEYILHLDKLLSFFKNQYRVEIKISREDT